MISTNHIVHIFVLLPFLSSSFSQNEIDGSIAQEAAIYHETQFAIAIERPSDSINTVVNRSETLIGRYRHKRQLYTHAKANTVSDGYGNHESTVYYYEPGGQSFKFTIPQKIPVEQSQLIGWIQQNKGRFDLTFINYEPPGSTSGSNFGGGNTGQTTRWVEHAKVNSTISGSNVVTNVYYFNQRGESFKFTMYQEFPVGQGDMLKWIKDNYRNYPITYIPYESQDGEQHSNGNQPSVNNTPSPPRQTPPPHWTYSQTGSIPTNRPSQIRPTEPPRTSKPRPIVEDHSKCGIPSYQAKDRIREGTEAFISEVPWQVAIMKIGEQKPFCGGSLITRRFILSAAHCFPKKPNPTRYVAIAGVTVLEDREDFEYRVQNIRAHKRYSLDSKRNDIAIISLFVEISFSLEVRPICILPQNYTYQIGTTCITSGWGETHTEGQYEQDLHKLDMEIYEKSYCYDRYRGEHELSTGMFCAGNRRNPNADVCFGDSGGPLACPIEGKYYLFGIISYGEKCAERKKQLPGIFTYVSKYINWIDNIMKEL